MGIIVGIVLVCIYIMFFRKTESPKPAPIVLEIFKTNNLSEMLSSIDYGRVYPYYIGMSFAEVKSSRLILYPLADSIEFEKALQSYEETRGVASLISLPNRNPYIENIILSFNENSVVDSIVIVIKDFAKNSTQLKELMCAKFGTHTPSDGRYIAWRDMRMAIRIDEMGGCIEVFYLRIC